MAWYNREGKRGRVFPSAAQSVSVRLNDPRNAIAQRRPAMLDKRVVFLAAGPIVAVLNEEEAPLWLPVPVKASA